MGDKIIAEVSVIPVGTGSTGLSHFVAACLDAIEGKKSISYQLTPMGTVLEGSLQDVLEAIRAMHEAPFGRGASRVVTLIKIDDRRDKKSTMAGKIESVTRLRRTPEKNR